MASWQSGDVAPPPSKGHEVADCNPWSLIMAYDLEFVFCGLDETYFGIWNSDIVVWMKRILEYKKNGSHRERQGRRHSWRSRSRSWFRSWEHLTKAIGNILSILNIFGGREISSFYSLATYHPQRWHIRRKPMEEKRSFVSPIKMKMASPQLK